MRAGVAALMAALGLASSAACAVEMYRWVDDTGRTNVSDVVPDRYRASAKRIDSRVFEIGDARRTEARAEAASQVARARALQPRVEAQPRPGLGASGSGAASTGTLTAASAAAPIAGNDCAARQQRYLAAVACFSPCVQSNGSVKVECFARCPVLVDPSPQCGLPKIR